MFVFTPTHPLVWSGDLIRWEPNLCSLCNWRTRWAGWTEEKKWLLKIKFNYRIPPRGNTTHQAATHSPQPLSVDANKMKWKRRKDRQCQIWEDGLTSCRWPLMSLEISALEKKLFLSQKQNKTKQRGIDLIELFRATDELIGASVEINENRLPEWRLWWR